MGYLEKIFLGTMVLFALGIFFIFALYFDVGDMFTGSLDRRGAISRGAAVDRIIDGIETRTRRAGPKKKRVLSSRAACAAPRFSTKGGAIKQRYEKLFPRKIKQGAARVDQYRRFLRGQGFSNNDFIEMEALAQNKTVVKRYIPIVNQFVADGEFGEAIKILEKALREINPKNLKVKSILLDKLTQVRMMNNDLDGAQQASDEMFSNNQRIIELKAATKLAENTKFQEELGKERERLSASRDAQKEFFADLNKRKLATGRWDGYLMEERAQVKANIMSARSAGKMTQQEYDDILKQLDKGMPYKHKETVKKRAAKVLDER